MNIRLMKASAWPVAMYGCEFPGERDTVMQETMPGARRRERPRTAWMDNINMWTRFPVEESIRMTEDRDKWRKYVHGVANPRIEDG